MSKIACTFSGRYGDILWSLPTVRAIAEQNNRTVDFFTMPQYANLYELLRRQEYIGKTGVIAGWGYTGSPCGDQPWEPQLWPERSEYDTVFHLTYKTHPTSFLANFIAASVPVSIDLKKPWISTRGAEKGYYQSRRWPYIAVGFNPGYPDQKDRFVEMLMRSLWKENIWFMDTNRLSWVEAAACISNSLFFLGCRSALHVLAHAVGKRMFIYEPDEGRRADTFVCTAGASETSIAHLGDETAVNLFRSNVLAEVERLAVR